MFGFIVLFCFIFIPFLNILFLLYLIINLFNPIVLQTTIKVYMLFWLIVMNWLIAFFSIRLWYIVDFYIIEVVNIRLNSLCVLLVVVIVLVSSCVILCSIDYLSVVDCCLFLFYICVFQFVMIVFVVSNNLILTIINWDWLGLISYLLINFWSSKTKSGIKAVVYNQVGDVCFLMIIAFCYCFVPFIDYCCFLSYVLFYLFFVCFCVVVYSLVISLSLIVVFFSKSAMLPLSSWLLNAMAAPTPVSSLLHSSTMVIAGVYLSLIMQPIIMLIIDCYCFVCFVLVVIPLYSLMWSVFKAISLSDIKSIIAFSTISQISYMFLAMYSALTLVCVFHIIVHAVFKAILFILAGSLIHIQSNFQSIYKLKILYCFISVVFVLASTVLIISLSKEGIIYSSYFILSSVFVIIIVVLGAIFTMLYTFKIYAFVFCLVFSKYCIYKRQLSFLLPWLLITSIFIDQSLYYWFCISASNIYYLVDYCCLLCFDWVCDFSLIVLVVVGIIWLDVNIVFLFKYPLFYVFVFSSRFTFIVLPFEYFYVFYSNFYFKGMISMIEVYTGLNSYSLYNVYYYSSILLLCFFVCLFGFLFVFI